MKLIDFNEVKQIELDILKYFAEFCDKNNLKYFLAYGTLIGAVRHKGFIPWDDDIDVWMPREDCNKLMEMFNADSNSYYKLINPLDDISRHSIVKIVDVRTAKIEKNVDYKNGYLGVDIDVFALDGQPENENSYNKWYNKIQKYYKAHTYYILDLKISCKTRIGFPIIRMLNGSKNKVISKALKMHAEYPYDNSEYVGAVETRFNSINNRFKKDWFSDYVLLDFECYKFKAPVGYNEILTKMYGNYMQLPPVEKQVTHHENNVFWLEDSDEKV